MFHSARFKLTAWYLIILMTISISFSAVIFKVYANEVERFDRLQRTRIGIRFGLPPPPMTNPELIEEAQRRMILNLVIINLAIAVLAGSGSYFLSGITLRPIKEMLDDQNRFISDASHEIRTPLTSLKTAMEVFLRGRKPTMKEAKTLIQESIVEVNKLQALSQSLLQLNQYQNPDGQTKLEKVNISEIVKEAIHKVLPIAKQKQILIETKLQGNYVQGNKDELTNLFVILLDNAIKYSPQKSKVQVETKKTDGHVAISIKDNGIGIAKSDLPHIFDRFYRSDSARSKKTSGGYGLGLSIAKKIANNNNASISVKSSDGKGSTFTVQLPRLK